MKNNLNLQSELYFVALFCDFCSCEAEYFARLYCRDFDGRK
jgi:hypothetical protein